MSNKRNWNFRGGKMPDEKNLVFRNITTKDIEKFVKERIIHASGGRLDMAKLVDMHLISVDIGRNFIPFLLQIPLSLRTKKGGDKKQRDDGNGANAPWFNVEDEGNKNRTMLDPAVFMIVNAYKFNKADVAYFTDMKGRKEARIMNGQDSCLFNVYSKPKMAEDGGSILVFLDPASVFGDYLVDNDNPHQKFVPKVDLAHSKRISNNEWSFTIIREVVKSKKGASIEESISSLRHPKTERNR